MILITYPTVVFELEKVMTQNKLAGDDIAFLLPHQANKRIIDATSRRMNLSRLI